MALHRPTTSAGSIVTDLMKCAVSPGQLYCAEYCFELKVDFKSNHNVDYGMIQLRQILTGLLNTSGGVITISSNGSKRVESNVLDLWKQRLEDTLIGFIPYDVCRSCIQILDYTSPVIMLVKRSTKLITLHSNMSIRWLAGCRTFNDIDTIRDVIHQAPAQRRYKHPLEGKTVIVYKSTMGEHEGPNIEYKMWKAVKVFDNIKEKNTYKSRFQEDRTSRTLFAFPNMLSGGYLIIGVEEDATAKINTVLGQAISDVDEQRLEEFLDLFLLQNDRGQPRIWGQEGKSPQKGKDYDISFIPVLGCPGNERRRVILIGFNHFKGGVFSNCPESYYVSEMGYVMSMELGEWAKHTRIKGTTQDQPINRKKFPVLSRNTSVQHMSSPSTTAHMFPTRDPENCPYVTNVHDIAQRPASDTTSDSPTDFVALHGPMSTGTPASGSGPKPDTLRGSMSSDTSSVQELPEVTLHGPLSNTSSILELPGACMAAVDKLVTLPGTADSFPQSQERREDAEGREVEGYLSWTRKKDEWKKHIGDSGIILEANIEKFATQSKLFKMKAPMALFPERYSILSGQDQNSGLEEALDHIQSSSVRSFGLVASHWASMIQQDHSQVTRPLNVIMDVFTVDESMCIRLWSISNRNPSTSAECWQALYVAGRVTKRNILMNQYQDNSPEFISSLAVDCSVYELGQGEQCDSRFACIRRRIMDITEFFHLSHVRLMEQLKLCLAKTLLLKETKIKDIFGEEFSVYLTGEQVEILLALGLDKFSYIEGAPGSGKTYLALHLCQEYSCVYICSTGTFMKFLEFQGVTSPVYVKSDENMEQCIGSQLFDSAEYVIIDDVHNLSLLPATWIKLFHHVAGLSATKLVILGDSCYQNYTSTRRDVCEQLQAYCRKNKYEPTIKVLSVIHRNNRKIASYIKSNFLRHTDHPESDRIASTHTADGDDIEVRFLQDVMTDDADNSLVQYVKTLVNQTQVIANESLSYEPKDVGVLLDTHNSTEDAMRLRGIFLKHMDEKTNVQDAQTFPVRGFTIDTLDNFMGIDRRVCILVTSEDIQDCPVPTGRSLCNPHYRTFAASRAITKAVFVVSKMTHSVLTNFKMDKITPIKNVKELWSHEKKDCILDLCFIRMNQRPALLYIEDSNSAIDLSLVTSEGLPLNLLVDNLVVNVPILVASTKNGTRVAIAGCTRGRKSSVQLAVYNVQVSGLELTQSFPVNSPPWSLKWSSDSDIIVVEWEDGRPAKVSKLCSFTGQRVWCRDTEVTHLCQPGHTSISCESGMIFITDQVSRIRKLTLDGQHILDINTKTITYPWAVCVESRGRSLFVSGYKESVVYLLHTEGGRPIKVIEGQDAVEGLFLHDDRYLAVTTGKHLSLYDVTGVLQNDL